jgi:hypothetical protein
MNRAFLNFNEIFRLCILITGASPAFLLLPFR